MNKQDLIKQGYTYIATQNSENKIELWAKFSGNEDIINYVFYTPLDDKVLEQTRRTTSYLQLDMMAQMRDKMRNDFLKLDVKFDKECLWLDEGQNNISSKIDVEDEFPDYE